MARKAAPIKSTSGAGFTFETQTVALLALHILDGSAPFDAGWGPPHRMDFQTRSAGWLLDDTLVTFTGDRNLALSIKSNTQITAEGIPAQFVSDVWEQRLHLESQVFNSKRDCLGLITAPLNTTLTSALQDLERWSLNQDDKTLLDRLAATGSASKITRKLFASLQCPAALATGRAIRSEDGVEVLRHLRFRQFDFQEPSSQDLESAIRRCQLVIRSGDREEASTLWRALNDLAKDQREAGGYIDEARLRDALSTRFSLRPWPRYEADYEAIGQWTQRALMGVPETIGFKVRIDRSIDVREVGRALNNNSIVVVLGPSGCGKTVLAKTWVISASPSTPILWLSARDLSRYTLSELEHAIGLSHPIDEVARAMRAPVGFCVVDGLEGLIEQEEFKRLAAIIRALGITAKQSGWHLLIVSQQEGWNAAYYELAQALGAAPDTHVLPVSVPTVEELADVWLEFPQLEHLRRQPHLSSLLHRPKVLDLVASRVAAGIEPQPVDWVGESSLANWFWTTYISTGPHKIARSQAMIRFAEYQADVLKPSLPVADMPPGSDSLLQDRIFVDRSGFVSYDHDLYGDWARVQLLLGKADDLRSFLTEKLVSPYWNRAVRLFGIYALEQDRSGQKWKAAIDQLRDEAGTGDLAQDLILEAAVFAADPLPLLEAVWQYLSADGGILIRRFLGRFLYVATFANRGMTALASTQAEMVRYSTYSRLPYGPLWLPVIKYLHAHLVDVVRLAPDQVGEISKTWLENTAPGMWVRREAAELAVALANDVIGHEWDYRHVSDDTATVAYASALAAIDELPNQVAAVARRAAGREKRSDNPRWSTDDADRSVRRSLPIPRRRPQEVKPWPDGPVQSPNEEFRKACFDTGALVPIIRAAPGLAREILLSLLIQRPREYEWGYGPEAVLPGGECEIDDHGFGHYPPFHNHLPWPFFLHLAPKEAINTILRLVNFATERRSEHISQRDGVLPELHLEIGGTERVWLGDGQQTYIWHTGLWGPHPISSVLMSLEHWLYQKLDAAEPAEEWIGQIVDGSRSVAFAGLLCSVATKHPTLLTGPLNFLLTSSDLLRIEKTRPVVMSVDTQMISWTGKSEAERASAREWHSMPHRNKTLFSTACELFFTSVDARATLFEARTKWELARDSAREAGYDEEADDLDRLVSVFTPDHYTQEYSEEHGGVLIQHQFPAELRDVSQRNIELANVGMLRITFPYRCRALLDGQETLSTDEQLEALWNEGQRALASDLSEFVGPVQAEDCACGLAAVMLVKYPVWLARHRERLKGCRAQILRTIVNPPAADMFDNDAVLSDWKWHSFCAEALPYIWVDDLSSRALRHSVLLMALDHHYKTVYLFFRSCHAMRDRLGEQRIQVEALLRHWAKERLDLRWREDRMNNNFILRPEERRSLRAILQSGRRDRNDLLSPAFRKAVRDFLCDRLPPELPALFSATDPPKPAASYNHLSQFDRRRGRYEIDIELVRHAYAYLENLDRARSEAERLEWLKIWRELLECLLRTLRPLSPEDADKDVNGTPYGSDDWILACIAILITQMRPSEKPEEFWQPILGLGSAAHYWVERFIKGFVNYGLANAHDPALQTIFIRLWSAMFDYAEALAGWQRRDLWEHLMGLDWWISSPWKDDHEATVEQMSDCFRRYAERHMIGTRATAMFLRFLRQPAARPLRVQSLLWMDESLRKLNLENDRGHLVEHLSLFLNECWQTQRDQIRRNPGAFASFKRLVKRAADHQLPLALEVQTRLLSG